jgi:exodeoxyribonuclease VII large subunit
VRGGGSLEDLAAFNTEEVARAIARCPVPLISGVGHEIDVTIADLCADERAATPSAAAERAAPDRAEIVRLLGRDRGRLQRAIAVIMERAGARLLRERDAIGMLSPTAQLALRRSRLRELAAALVRESTRASTRVRSELAGMAQALPRAVGATLIRERSRLAVLAPALPRVARARATAGRAELGEAVARLEALSPLAVLGRGYALARRAEDDRIVRRAGDIAPGERLAVRVAEAEIEARVERVVARDGS